MTRQEKIEAALQKVTDGSVDVIAIWREAFGADQVTFEQFRRWLHVVREMPDELLTAIGDAQSLSDQEAFAACCPDYVSPEEFQIAAHVYLNTQKEADTQESVPVEEQEAAEVETLAAAESQLQSNSLSLEE